MCSTLEKFILFRPGQIVSRLVIFYTVLWGKPKKEVLYIMNVLYIEILLQCEDPKLKNYFSIIRGKKEKDIPGEA